MRKGQLSTSAAAIKDTLALAVKLVEAFLWIDIGQHLRLPLRDPKTGTPTGFTDGDLKRRAA